MTTKLNKLKKEEKQALSNLMTALYPRELELFNDYLEARHKREIELLS